MNIDDMRAAVREAKATLQRTDNMVEPLAEMVVGRLRHCSDWTLRKLKRELRDYNPHTKQWRQR